MNHPLHQESPLNPPSPPMGVRTTVVGAGAAPEFHAVVRAAFAARPQLDPPADALSESVDSIATALGRSRGILALDGDTPVGTVLLDVDPDDSSTVWLRRFGVHPDAQGHGVANLLLDAAVTASGAQQSMRVVAREELPRTCAFWTSHGFVEVARHSPYVELVRPLVDRHVVVDADEMRDLGHRVGALLEAGDVVVLTGGLGAGKTTFTQGLGEGLGVRGPVTSPTFVIARVHPSLVEGPALVHVDAYRLGGVDELDDLDLDTSLDEAVTVVEWGAGLAEGLSRRRLEISIARAEGDELADELADGELDPRVVELRWVAAP